MRVTLFVAFMVILPCGISFGLDRLFEAGILATGTRTRWVYETAVSVAYPFPTVWYIWAGPDERWGGDPTSAMICFVCALQAVYSYAMASFLTHLWHRIVGAGQGNRHASGPLGVTR